MKNVFRVEEERLRSRKSRHVKTIWELRVRRGVVVGGGKFGQLRLRQNSQQYIQILGQKYHTNLIQKTSLGRNPSNQEKMDRSPSPARHGSARRDEALRDGPACGLIYLISCMHHACTHGLNLGMSSFFYISLVFLFN